MKIKKFFELLFLFAVGGLTYFSIELLWRGYSHPTMITVGGASFVLAGMINETFSWELLFWYQCAISSIMILIVEFISGCILNIWLGLGIWDYSNLPFNILGQVCIQFAFAWYLLSAVAIVLDDYLRYWIFKEEKPHYKFK